MSCVIGLAHSGNVILCGDSASVGGNEMAASSVPKVFKRDVPNLVKGHAPEPMLLGFTGSYRKGNLLMYQVEIPYQLKSDIAQYMVCDFIPAVRACFTTHLTENKEDDFSFLVGYKGILFSIFGDLQVNQVRRGWDVIGSGQYFGVGAMEALKYMKDGRKRVQKAMAATAEYCNEVCAPFVMATLYE